MKGGGKNI